MREYKLSSAKVDRRGSAWGIGAFVTDRKARDVQLSTNGAPAVGELSSYWFQVHFLQAERRSDEQ
jgi:hypothetical protein